MTNIPNRDENGREVVLSAIAPEGWIYLALDTHIKAFKAANPIRSKKLSGTDYTTTVKYFDAEYSGNELTGYTQENLDSSAKRMEITLSIGIDFSLVKGQCCSSAYAPYNLYLDVANGLVALGDAYIKTFVEGLNLKNCKDIHTDGKSPKRLNRDLGFGVDGNVFKVVLRRDTATSQEYDFELILEFYRA